MKQEDLKEGTLYVISDTFFRKVKDPYLMKNHGSGYRPICFVFTDQETGIPWVVPYTTKISKFDTEIQKIYEEIDMAKSLSEVDKLRNKLLGYKKCKIDTIDCYMLFSNMFPINANYIKRPYMVNGNPYTLNEEDRKQIYFQAKAVLKLLKGGFKFKRTQPDIMKIEKIMMNEKNK